MNLLHLKQFYEIGREGQVSRAARTLRISQPALSKSIALLEADLGVKLFERTRQGVTLTPAGKMAFEHAGRIFAQERELLDHLQEELLQERKAGLQGSWRLGASDNLAIYVLPDLVAGFKAKNPHLRVSLYAGTSSDIKNEIAHDRCDAGIFFTPLRSTEPFSAKKVGETEFWVVIARDSRWVTELKRGAKSAHVTIEDLKRANVPRIESRHSDYQGGKFPAHFHSHRLGFTAEPWLEVNHHEVKKRLILGGHGFSIMVAGSVEKEVKEGQLVKVKTDFTLSNSIYWVTKKSLSPSRATRLFLEELKGWFKNH